MALCSANLRLSKSFIIVCDLAGIIGLLVEPLLNDEVIFLEHAPSMPVAYSVSNVIVSASIEPEAFGRISVEAQSMKKPIVASDIGGSRETIVDNKKEILLESNLLNLKILAAVIVIPALLTPGINASV